VYDDAGALVAERAFTARELRLQTVWRRELAYTWQPFATSEDFDAKYAILRFEPQKSSRGRRYRLVADCTRGTRDDGTTLWRSNTMRYHWQGEPASGDAPEEWVLLFDFACGKSAFTPIARVARSTLHRYDGALGPYFSVSDALVCANEERALERVQQSEFDPRRTVVLERADAAESTRERGGDGVDGPALRDASALEPAARAEVISRAPNEVKLRVARKTPGWLVACQSHFPGWKATVNGVEKPLLHANYAFGAVEIGAGESEVDLIYEPTSLRIGLFVALASAAAALACLAYLARPRIGRGASGTSKA
jgi:hypothetical protein